MTTDVLIEIQKFAEREVALGFDSDEEIVESANHLAFERSGREDIDPDVRRIVAEVADAHRIEEAGWDKPTDCDRIDEAFATLEQQAIVARQNFACCNNCGFAEIWDEVDAVEFPVEGYVFFHFQATERALDRGELLLAYGTLDEGNEALLHVGRMIVNTLTRAGLKAVWAENDRSPIIISDLVWKKRRPLDAPRNSDNPWCDDGPSDRPARRGSCS